MYSVLPGCNDPLCSIPYKLQDQSLADVAAQLNISQKTAEAHLTKALRIIRSNVGDVLNFLIVLYTMLMFR